MDFEESHDEYMKCDFGDPNVVNDEIEDVGDDKKVKSEESLLATGIFTSRDLCHLVPFSQIITFFAGGGNSISLEISGVDGGAKPLELAMQTFLGVMKGDNKTASCND